MSDPYSDCYALYLAQLKTLATSTSFFPAMTGRAAGWQITEDDNIIHEGGDYFIVLRPGSFEQNRVGSYQTNTWRVRAFIFMRYQEYEGLWTRFRAYRAAILELPDTQPLKQLGIYEQVFSAPEDAGYLRDENGNYTNFVTQTLDCVITQRRLVTRAL